jgi:hypothetical protein
MENW